MENTNEFYEDESLGLHEIIGGKEFFEKVINEMNNPNNEEEISPFMEGGESIPEEQVLSPISKEETVKTKSKQGEEISPFMEDDCVLKTKLKDAQCFLQNLDLQI